MKPYPRCLPLAGLPRIFERVTGSISVIVVASVLTLSACGGSSGGGGTLAPTGQNETTPEAAESVVVSVKGFDSAEPCVELRDYIAGYADSVMRAQLSQARNAEADFIGPVPVMASATSGSFESTQASVASDRQAFTTTNLQTAGVDELDWMKNDASHVYRIHGDAHRAWLSKTRYQPAASLEARGQLELPSHAGEAGLFAGPRGLFLTENARAIVLSSLEGYYPVAFGSAAAGSSVGFTTPCISPVCQPQAIRQRSFVDLLDVSGDGPPALQGGVEVGGRLLDARRQGNRLWLVTHEPFVFPLTLRWWPQGLAWNAGAAERAAAFDTLIEQNAAAIAAAPLTDWLPSDLASKVRAGGQSALAACRTVRRVSEPSQLGWLKVASVNVDDRSMGEETILADAQTVYGSTKALYITTPNWRSATTTDPGPRTYVHKFAIDGHGQARYSGSGAFAGTPLNSYSFDEDASGQLRFAANALRPQSGGAAGVTSWENYSYLGVLAPKGDRLLVVSRSEPIAPGERMQSVRFVGSRAYLVTFRVVDPFFVYEMSTTGAPKQLGELKLPGFSTYLHPVGDRHILGIGYADGGWPRQIKATLFDVSDPTSPREQSSLALGDVYSSSEALWDPHAFTYLPRTRDSGLMAIPLWSYPYSNSVGESSSVRLVNVSAVSGLSLAGRLAVDDLLPNKPVGTNSGSLFVRRSILTPDHVIAVGQRLLRSAGLAQPELPLATLVTP